MEAARGPETQREGIFEEGREHRRGTLVGGVLAILAGVVAIIVPAVASVAIALVVGWVLVAASACIAVDAFAKGGFARTAFRLVLALATLAAGLYLVLAPLRGTYTLTVMLVIWFVAVGFSQVMIGLAEIKLPGAGLLIVSGAISLVLGILIANRLPEAADWAIGLLVGIQLICYGIAAVGAYSLGGSDGRSPQPA
jgi:uncharacterized membrane protein HdeD (DUF308 family)